MDFTKGLLQLHMHDQGTKPCGARGHGRSEVCVIDAEKRRPSSRPPLRRCLLGCAAHTAIMLGLRRASLVLPGCGPARSRATAAGRGKRGRGKGAALGRDRAVPAEHTRVMVEQRIHDTLKLRKELPPPQRRQHAAGGWVAEPRLLACLVCWICLSVSIRLSKWSACGSRVVEADTLCRTVRCRELRPGCRPWRPPRCGALDGKEHCAIRVRDAPQASPQPLSTWCDACAGADAGDGCVIPCVAPLDFFFLWSHA